MAGPGDFAAMPSVRRHCGLCRLAYVPGDVVCSADGSREHVVTAADKTHIQSHEDHEDAEYGFHSFCRQLATTTEAKQVASLFSCSDRVHQVHENRRMAWASQRLSADANHDPGSAPSTTITRRRLVSEYLTLNAIHVLRAPPRPSSIASLSREIHYATANVEGRDYVVALTNHPTSQTKPVAMLVPEVTPLSVVYVQYDSLGVLRIAIGSPHLRPAVIHKPGRCWVSFAVSNFAYIVGKTNHVVIKNIFCATRSMMNSASQRDISCASPMPRPALYARMIRDQRTSLRHTSRGTSTHHVLGYSARWHGGLVSFYVHTSPYDMPDYDQPHDTWYYLPMDAPSERIIRIWSKTTSTPGNSAVVVETSRGRLVILGSYPRHDGGRVNAEDWQLLRHTDARPSRIQYQGSDVIRAASYDGPRPGAGHALVIPDRSPPRQGPALHESFYYNEADFRDVRTVIPCRVGKAYTGMILVYRNGHKATVGSVRLDRLQEPIELNDRSDLWLGVSQEPGACPYITVMSPNEPAGHVHHTHVDRTGRLGWWWSKQDVQVTFERTEGSESQLSSKSLACSNDHLVPWAPLLSKPVSFADSYDNVTIAPEHLKPLAMTMQGTTAAGHGAKEGAEQEEARREAARQQEAREREAREQEAREQEARQQETRQPEVAYPPVREPIRLDALPFTHTLTPEDIETLNRHFRTTVRVHAMIAASYSTRSRTATAPGNVMRPSGNYMSMARMRLREEEMEARARAMAAGENSPSPAVAPLPAGEHDGGRVVGADRDAEADRNGIVGQAHTREVAHGGGIGGIGEGHGTTPAPIRTLIPQQPAPVSRDIWAAARSPPVVTLGPAPLGRAASSSRTRPAYDPIERTRKRPRTDSRRDGVVAMGDLPLSDTEETINDPVANGVEAGSRAPAMAEMISDTSSFTRSTTRLPPWHRDTRMTPIRRNPPAAEGSATRADSTVWSADGGRRTARESSTRPARGNRSRSPQVRSTRWDPTAYRDRDD